MSRGVDGSISQSRTFRLAEQVHKLLGRVSKAVGFVGTVMLGLLGLLVCADVAGRAFGNPITGVVEIAKMVVVIVTFLMMPYTMHSGAHIRSTVIVKRLPARVGLTVEVSAGLIGAIVFGVIAYASWDAAVYAWVAGSFEGEGARRVPTWPARWSVTFASFLMFLECGSYALRTALGGGQR